MKRALLNIVFAASALASTAPVWAQDEGEDDSSGNDEVPALLAYLGLTAASGKDTAGDGAGSGEAFILTTILLEKAAGLAHGELAENTTYLVAPDKDKLDLSSYSQTEGRIDRLANQLVRFAEDPEGLVQTCVRARASDPNDKDMSLFNKERAELEDLAKTPADFKFKGSDFVGALAFDTSFKALALDLNTGLFVTALAGKASKDKDVRIWSEVAKAPEETEASTKLEAIEGEIAAIDALQCTEKLPESDAKKFTTQIAKLKAAAASFRAPGKEGAPSPLEAADRAAGALENQKTNLRVLRLSVDKAQGTLISNSSIWTSIGLPGTTVRSALVVSYRSVEPMTGKTDGVGIIACSYPMRVLQSVNVAKLQKLRENGVCDFVLEIPETP
ncbi:MAG: hypothetical protein AAF559_09805 [Pseudomonadota bacterium]